MYDQINVFFPAIIYLGNQFVQTIKQETYIENPATKKWHLFQFNYPSGKNWKAVISNKTSFSPKCPSIHVTKFQSHEQFFEATSNKAKYSPINSKFAYLTPMGASRHNLFYALNVDEKFRHIGLTQMLDGWVKPDIQKIVPIQLMPSGRIIPLAHGTTLPKRFQTVHTPLVPSEQGAYNLHVAKEALKSDLPDGAVLLLSLMIEISTQSFGGVLPGVDITLGGFIDTQANEIINGKWQILPAQMRMLRALFREANGWWDWIWDAQGNFRPIFQPNLA
ncbi:hypothetical protein NIES4071_104150 (plasmid) [Calothrix sp. NIES-4071]|nr:hypothetical protein NIES4071_104150 [Calothrix sp. NIES-4071]BAZ64402.1 hypothetical protein NIES4105_101350 [Calothrix sp. NIES-4105]